MEEIKFFIVIISLVIVFFVGRWMGYVEGCKDNHYKIMLDATFEGIEALAIKDEDQRKEAMKAFEEKCKNPYAFMKR